MYRLPGPRTIKSASLIDSRALGRAEGNKKLNIPKNTPFSELDGNTFACPVCRAGKNFYKDIGPKSKPSGFEENLVYGFGFNSLPPGQKKLLIFGGLAFAAAMFLSLYSLH